MKQILVVKYQVFSQLSFYWLISQLHFSEFSIKARVRALGRHLLKRMDNSLLSLGLKRLAPALFCCRLLTVSPKRTPLGNLAIEREATTAQAGKAIFNLTANSLRSDFNDHRFEPEALEPILMNDVVAAFNEYFEVIYPDTPELLREVFRLRYRVLCIEQRLPGFDASCYPEEYECDSYDDHSAHILLRHSPSGEFVGTARLILPDARNPEKRFPIERHTQFNPALFDIRSLPRQHTAEISRLLVVRRFRRRKEDNKVEAEVTVAESRIKKQRRFPHPILALVVGIIRMSAQHNITHCFSVMDPSLNRLLSPLGLQFDAIGPLTEYHGLRRPYHIDLQKMLKRMYVNNRQIWELITGSGSVRLIQEKKQLEAPSYETEQSRL